jgi:hypothetical protein
VVPATKFDGAKQNGVGITQACMAMPVYSDQVAPNSGLAPVGEVRLMPDTQTLAPLPWYPSHKMAVGELHIHPGAAPPPPPPPLLLACWMLERRGLQRRQLHIMCPSPAGDATRRGALAVRPAQRAQTGGGALPGAAPHHLPGGRSARALAAGTVAAPRASGSPAHS